MTQSFSMPPPNITFEDSSAPFWMLRKNGYYIVGTKYYAHKMHALIEASKTRNKIQWEFGSDVFDKINWRQPVNIGLTELYRMRAQQLRDKYDYLVLAFSGGADSTNVLDSFLNNGIHLDEVLIHWPRKLTQGRYQVSKDTTAYNVLSEWELAVIPKLEHIQNNYPKTKITIDDLEDLTDEYSEDAVSITKNKFHYLNIKRQRSIARRTSQIMQKKPNMAIIYGFDKPRLLNVNNVLCAFFTDGLTSVVSDLAPGYERNVEYFYWSTDLPELPVKQSQILYHLFRSQPALQKNIETKQLKDIIPQPDSKAKAVREIEQVEMMRKITSEALYPSWNQQVFQADKPQYFAFKCEYHAWIKSYSDSQALIDSWTSAFNQYNRLVDPAFMLTDDGLYQGFSTKLYPLGTL